MAGCLTTAAVLSVGFGAFISGNKVLAQNMMCATTSKASECCPRPAGAGGRSQLQIPPQAAPGSGLPRPTGRLGGSGSDTSAPSFRRRRARVAAQFTTIAVMGAATKYSLDSSSDDSATAEATKPAPAVPGPAVV